MATDIIQPGEALPVLPPIERRGQSVLTTTPADGVERRLHQYPGSVGYVARWFIATDLVPMPYRTEAEAHAELQRRRAERGAA